MSEPTSEQSIFLGAIALTSPAARSRFPTKCVERNRNCGLNSTPCSPRMTGWATPVRLRVRTIPERRVLRSKRSKRIGGRRPGAVIGAYKLSQQIGEGGMGSVYMAQQTHPSSAWSP